MVTGDDELPVSRLRRLIVDQAAPHLQDPCRQPPSNSLLQPHGHAGLEC